MDNSCEKEYRAIIIGSSMAMPRMEVHYEQTWIYELIRKFPKIEFIDKSRRASTSMRLVSDGAGAGDKTRSADLLEYYSPDLVITQIGVTDCAPRLFKKGSFISYLLHVLPNNFGKFVVNSLKKYRGRKAIYADVSPEKFKTNWKQYIERCKKNDVFVICILIGMPAKRFIANKSPEIIDSIKKYNSILIQIANNHNNVYCIEPFTEEEVETCALDEFHVNTEGHKILSEKLIKKINEFLAEKQKQLNSNKNLLS